MPQATKQLTRQRFNTAERLVQILAGRGLPLACLLLFVVSYVAFMTHMWLTRPPAQNPLRAAVSAALSKMTDRGDAPLLEPPLTANSPPSIVRASQGDVAGLEVPAENPTRQVTATPQQVNEWISRAAGSVDESERAEAIMNLNKFAGGNDIVQGVASVLSRDTSVRNRRLAVYALMNLVENGADASQVVPLLQQAMSDSDSAVSMPAKNAYNKVMGIEEHSPTADGWTAEEAQR